jgi:hypothetical protein
MNLFKNCNKGVHRFEPRYDKSEAIFPWDRFESIKIRPDTLETMRRITYVCDVCIRCGKTIKRESEVIPFNQAKRA